MAAAASDDASKVRDDQMLIRFTAILLQARNRFENHPDYGKGIKRDRAVMDFLLGAASATLTHADHALYAHIVRVTTYVVAIRGYKEIEAMLKKWDFEMSNQFMAEARRLTELPDPNTSHSDA